MDKKITRILHWLTLVALVVSIGAIVFLTQVPGSKLNVHRSASELNLIGTYQLNDEREKALKMYDFLDEDNIMLNPGQTLLLRGHFDRELKPYEPISLFTADAKVTLYVNGEEIKSQGRQDEVSELSTYVTTGLSETDDIMISLNNNTEETANMFAFFTNMTSGADYGYFYYQIRDNFPDIIMSAITMFIGILLIAGGIVAAKAKSKQTKELLCFGGFVISCALWFSTDATYFTAFVPYPKIMNALQLISLCFTPIAALCYAETIVKKIRLRRSLCVNLALLLLLLGFYLIVETGEHVHHNSHMLIAVILMVLSLLNVLACLFIESSEHMTGNMKLIFTMLSLIFGGIIFDTIYYSLDMSVHSTIFQAMYLIALMVMLYNVFRFIFISIHAAQRSAELERELLQSRISIMLSQIKPHFMFNTLNAISALCMSDPLKADEVIVKFSDYLRGNINSLETPVPIPFEKELHHVKNYADIEQVRFGKKLNVVYDIQFTDFTMPTLTLQPIVENAIRHGIGKKADSGTVWIRCSKEQNMAVIRVEDDGVGFDMSTNYKREDSIGMKNVKTRLEGMMHATIHVVSEVGKGTKTTIKIPLGNKEST